MRTRFNLLATAAGTRPEVDLWPHLKGLTACVIADPSQPGRPGGALVVWHCDSAASAERLTVDVLPRLGALLTGKKPATQRPGGGPPRNVATAQLAGRALGTRRSELGTVSGRSLLAIAHGRDAVIAWGEDALSASLEAMATPDRSAAALCTDWARDGENAPQRLGLIWPARCWPPVRGVSATTPAWRVLTQDPPVVWWGWTGRDEARDSIQFSGLRQRVHQFVDQIPLDPSPPR